MPRSTMQKEDAYSLPEDVLFDGKLNSVTTRNISGTDKKGKPYSFDLWVWEFEITSGEHQGRRAWGETEDKLNNLEEPKGRAKLQRPWVETLLGRQVGIGEDFDTDQVIGLPCKFTVTHEEPRQKKDGGMFYGCPVDDVFPADGASGFVPF